MIAFAVIAAAIGIPSFATWVWAYYVSPAPLDNE